MLVEHPSGTIFVSGYGSNDMRDFNRQAPHLWRSDDHGAHWMAVNVGTPEQGARGNSDVDLAVGPDGTLYFVNMEFDIQTLRGTRVTVGVSHDTGATWTWSELSRDDFDDRPWVAVAPDGTAHVIWNDGAGVRHATSTDGGRTWTEQQRIHPHGGSSHLAVGPHGEVAVRISPLSASGNRYDEGVDLIAVSTDGGATWLTHAVPGKPVWPRGVEEMEKEERWVEPLAWDRDGALYHLWGEEHDLWLARSLDRGATWQKWVVARDDDRVFYPYLAARGPGELLASWFSGRGETLAVHVARIDVGESGAPRVVPAEPIQFDAWTRRGDPTRDTGGEYIAVAFLSNGTFAAVTPIQNADQERWGFTFWQFDAR